MNKIELTRPISGDVYAVAYTGLSRKEFRAALKTMREFVKYNTGRHYDIEFDFVTTRGRFDKRRSYRIDAYCLLWSSVLGIASANEVTIYTSSSAVESQILRDLLHNQIEKVFV